MTSLCCRLWLKTAFPSSAEQPCPDPKATPVLQSVLTHPSLPLQTESALFQSKRLPRKWLPDLFPQAHHDSRLSARSRNRLSPARFKGSPGSPRPGRPSEVSGHLSSLFQMKIPLQYLHLAMMITHSGSAALL